MVHGGGFKHKDEEGERVSEAKGCDIYRWRK